MDALKESVKDEHVIFYNYLTSFHQVRNHKAGLKCNNVCIPFQILRRALVSTCMRMILLQLGNESASVG